MQKTKYFVTLTWICNKVKMKDVLHIYNDCAIDWNRVCSNMFGLSRAHKITPVFGTDACTLPPPYVYLAPGGGCEVCLYVCLCPANILVFFSAIRRDIDLKFIQDTYTQFTENN